MAKATGQGRKRGEYVAGTGTKKIAPVNMKKQEHQFAIDGYLIDETLKQIPQGISILQAKVRVYSAGKKRRTPTTNALRKLGVQSIFKGAESTDAVLVFDQISKTELQRNVKEVCAEIGLPYDKAFFTYLVLTNGEATGRFEHVTKEVKPDETDLRKKLRVLGLTTGTGKVQGLVSDLGAKKFFCRIKEEPVKFIMCERE